MEFCCENLICNIFITCNIVVNMDDVHQTISRKTESISASSEAEDSNLVG
jgi:hypothetical protein